jgi:hypothetical protein
MRSIMNSNTRNGGTAARQAAADKLVSNFAKLDRKLDAREAKRKAKKKKPLPRVVLRLRNIEKFMADLYGSILPEEDEGALVDLSVLVATAKAAGKPAINFIRKWAPRMRQDEAERFVAEVDINLAFLDADAIAKRMGVNFASKERLKVRTIGAYDVPKAERKRIYRQRYEAKRKQAAAEKKPAMSKREQAVLKMVGVMASMGDVAEKAKRHPLFRGREDIPRQVRRIVEKLEKSGHFGSRLEPRDRGGTERYIWNEAIAKAKENAAAQAHPENVRRGTPIFIGSNRRTKSLVRTPKERYENSGGVKWGPVDEAEPWPASLELRRPHQPESDLERRAS